MKKLIFLFCITFAVAQNNGIRSLNGALNNSQRLTVDTSSSVSSFRWTLSNGVHTLNIPYRIANLSAGGAVGDADSLGGVPASGYVLVSDSASRYVTKSTTQVVSGKKYMYWAKIDTLLASPDNVMEVAKSGRQYTSIQTAITSALYGDVILVYPGTYSENVVFYASDSGKTLLALDRNTTTIDSLKIYGKDVSVFNITVSGVLKVLSQNTFSYPKTINLYNSKFSGDAYFGTADSSLKYAVKVFNCLFAYDTSKQLMINNGSNEEYSINIYNSEIPKMKLRAVGGRGNWYYSSLGLSLLEYVTANTTTNINFENCDSNIDSLITLSSNTLAYHIFVVRGGSTGNYLASVGTVNSTWTFSGKFELDILDSRFYYPNIVFNSTANSRFMHVRGHGYNNANTITGTGLSKLYIQQSIFKTAPPSGLGNNVLNIWYAFLDN